MNKRDKKKGFTLLEIVIVVGVFAVLASLALPLTMQTGQDTKLRTTAKQLESILFTYQQNALHRLNNTSYGIAFYANKYTLFKGSALASASETEDIAIPSKQYLSTITLTGGGTEIVFSQGSFRPNKSGSINLTDSFSTFVIDINSEGLIKTYKL